MLRRYWIYCLDILYDKMLLSMVTGNGMEYDEGLIGCPFEYIVLSIEPSALI